jgi:HEAT repeat protein
MGQLKNSKFIEPLVKALQDRNTLFFTVDALGDLGFAEAQTPLKRLLKDDLWFNRLNALEALSKLPIDNLFALAREALKDENDMVRNAASRIIASQNKKSNNSI